ncbi:MAG: ABC transporter family substrate-binding protein [Solirubrobacteraceae bacterium]
MNAYRRGLAIAALLAAGLVAGGCGGPAKQGGALKRSDINPLPRDRVRQGGTLRWAIEQFSTQWNANQLNGPEASTAAVLGGMMPSPFVSDERGNVAVDRNYVTSARVTSSSPRQVVTYRLNPKAHWSDGKPITWRDYEAQWKALRSPQHGFEIASSTGYERIASVKPGRDPYEVVVTFARRYGEWQGLFGLLYPAATNSDPKKFNTGWLDRIPVTAGPFKLGKIDQTAKTITIVRDPRWWGPPAKLDSIVFRALAVDAAINAFASGEVDVVDVGVNPSNYKRVLGVRGASVREAAGPDFRHFTFNATSPELADVAVRRAVAMAINRDALARADLTGLNWPPRTMNNHFFVNTQTGYRDDAGQVGRFDPGTARRLLDQAGWRRSGAFRRKGSRTLELRFVIPTGVGTSRQEGELTQAMLKDVGIKLDITAVPEDDFFDKYISTGDFDVAPFSWIGTPFPISSAQSIYVKPTRDAKGQLQIQQNFARVGSPAIDDLMSRAQEELDLGRARDLINQADRLVWDEVHSIVLFQRPQITAVKSSLANMGSFGFKSTIYQDIGFAK